MRIIIAGDGEITEYLAEILSDESQDVIVVSDDRDALSSIDTLCNVLTHCGNPLTVETLSKLDMPSCKMFISMLPSDTENLIACSVAKSLGAKITVSRISDYSLMATEDRSHFKEIGVDTLVNYESLAAAEIMSLLLHPWTKSWTEFFGGDIIVAAVSVEKDSIYEGVSLNDLEQGPSRPFHVGIIQRGTTTIIPHGDDIVSRGDILYVVTTKDSLQIVAQAWGNPHMAISKVVIMGGSEIGVRLSNDPRASGLNIKIIEKEEPKARWIRQHARNCTVIRGDGSKTGMLEYAGQADAYLALSKSDEVNILSCVTASEMGIPYQAAVVNDLQNIALAEHLGVNAVINRKMLAANFIFRELLDWSTDASSALALTDAEIISLTARPDSPITKARVRDLRLPSEITLLGIVHDGQAKLVTGETRVMPGDHLVAACRTGFLSKVQLLFS